MELTLIDEDGAAVVEGTRGISLMRRAQDATLVIGAGLSAGVRDALLYPENLPAHIFGLSSGEAGDILDKLRRYQLRVAIVCEPGSVAFSSRFMEIQSDDLRVFKTREAARVWLRRCRGQSADRGVDNHTLATRKASTASTRI